MNRNTVTVCRIALLALVVVTVAQAFGQGRQRMSTPNAPDDPYIIGYFSNNTPGAPDGVLRLTNDGENGAPHSKQTANIYVFDNNEELVECCCTEVSANGYLSLSVSGNLTANPIHLPSPKRGIVKVVSSASNPSCDAGGSYTQLGGIKGWITHIQSAGAGAFSITEEEMLDADLSTAELTYLQTTCAFIESNDSGFGVCTTGDSGE